MEVVQQYTKAFTYVAFPEPTVQCEGSVEEKQCMTTADVKSRSDRHSG